jgi:hypothetical protein
MAVASSLGNAAARLELGRVLDERILPPEILLPGAKHNHEVKCLAAGYFDISVQHSDTSFALGMVTARDLREINADNVERGLTNIEIGSVLIDRA